MTRRHWRDCALTCQDAMRRAPDSAMRLFWAGLAVEFLVAGGFEVTL